MKAPTPEVMVNESHFFTAFMGMLLTSLDLLYLYVTSLTVNVKNFKLIIFWYSRRRIELQTKALHLVPSVKFA